MKLYAIGLPGNKARIVVQVEDPAQQTLEGEVYIEVPIPTCYMINQEGTAAKPFTSSEEKWSKIRVQRSAMLSQSDWTQIPDVPDNIKEVWKTYRQALRDITDQSDPDKIVWPTEPQ